MFYRIPFIAKWIWGPTILALYLVSLYQGCFLSVVIVSVSSVGVCEIPYKYVSSYLDYY